MHTVDTHLHEKPLRPNMARQKVEHLKQAVNDPDITIERKHNIEREIHSLSMRLGVFSGK